MALFGSFYTGHRFLCNDGLLFKTVVVRRDIIPLLHAAQGISPNVPPNTIPHLIHPQTRPNKHTLRHIQPLYGLHLPSLDHILNILYIQIQPPIRPTHQLAFL
jgi:hypothetical protein